jgi:hypothetical protein
MSTTTSRRKLAASCTLFVAAALVWARPATVEAIPLTIVDPIYVDSDSPAPPHLEAGVEAHIFENSITLASAAYFQAAWDAWNGTQPANAQWTLVDGGTLANLGLTVSVFDAESFHGSGHVGGVEIVVEIDYNGADRDDLVWSQGLYDNYTLGPGGGIVPPFYEMDVSTNPAHWQPPAYPFQYEDEHFYDFPKAPFETGFFEADAFLSKVDYNARTLTIFDGVEYGFYVYAIDVPEPSTWLLMVTAMGFLAVLVQRSHPKRV